MKNIKKALTILCFFAIFIIFGIAKSNASSSNLYLNNLEFMVQINTDGSMDVTETWDIDIEDTNTLYKTFKTDETKYSKISNVKVKEITSGDEKNFISANKWAYHLAKNYYYGGNNSDGLFEISWGVGLDSNSDTRKYEISYTVEDAVAKYDDYAELYWQFVGEDFEISANNINGTILLPYDVNSKDEIKIWGHTEDLNGEIYTTALDKIEFYIDNFRSGRYVEIRTLFPTNMISYSSRGEQKEILNDVIEEETIWANQANEKRERKAIIKLIVGIVISIVCGIICIILINKLIKTIKKISTTVKLKPTQEMIYYREIPREKETTPAEALYLYKNIKYDFQLSDIGKIFSATLLDLNLKKIIDFEIIKQNSKKEIITIKLLKDNSEELDNVNDEKTILRFLKYAMGKEKQITLDELQKYIKKHPSEIEKIVDELKKNVETRLSDKEIIDKENKKKYSKLNTSLVVYIVLIIYGIMGAVFLSVYFGMLVGVVCIITSILLIANAISVGILKNKINVFTQKGIDEQEQWKGLKKYMEEFSLLKEKELPEIVLWEKFLVYATAFGIEKKVLEQLKIVYPNFENDMSINTYAYMNLMLNTNFSNSFSSAISSSISSAYSSGSGSGGGFSGGGGRRPVAGGRWRRKINLPQAINE